MVTINSNGHDKFDITWEHVPAKYLNGELVGYKLRVSLDQMGGRPALNGETVEKFIYPSLNKFTISGLKPNAQYSMILLAFNEFGDGVSSSPVIGGKSNSHDKCKTQICRLIKHRFKANFIINSNILPFK